MKILYSTENDGHDYKFKYETSREVGLELEYEREYLANEVADDYHTEHDGWESYWPIEFKLYKECGELIGTYTIERESQPVFSAMEK